MYKTPENTLCRRIVAKTLLPDFRTRCLWCSPWKTSGAFGVEPGGPKIYLCDRVSFFQTRHRRLCTDFMKIFTKLYSPCVKQKKTTEFKNFREGNTTPHYVSYRLITAYSVFGKSLRSTTWLTRFVLHTRSRAIRGALRNRMLTGTDHTAVENVSISRIYNLNSD